VEKQPNPKGLSLLLLASAAVGMVGTSPSQFLSGPARRVPLQRSATRPSTSSNQVLGRQAILVEGQLPTGLKSRQLSHISRRAAVEVMDKNISTQPYCKDDAKTWNSYLLLQMGDVVVNATWTRLEERGDVDTTFQLSTGVGTARYAQHTSGGEGWNVCSKRFELLVRGREMKTLVNSVVNPQGVDTIDAHATPIGQLSSFFNRALEPSGMQAPELMGVVAEKLKGDDVEHLEEFQELWSRYA